MGMIRSRLRVAGVCGLCGWIMLASAEEGQNKRKRSVPASGPAMLLQDIVRKNVKIVERVSPDAKQLTQTEWTAVEDLAACRSSSAVKHLLRIIHIREPNLGGVMKLPNGTFVRKATRQQAMRRGLSAALDVLSNRPAAEALVSIGLPSVREIRVELELIRPKPIPSATLRLYAKVLLSILGREHVRRYIEEERTHAPKTAEAEYDRLLALPEMNLKPQQWRRGASKATRK